MTRFTRTAVLAAILMTAVLGICRAANAGHVPLKSVFVPLANNVNAVLLEPVKPRARHGSFAILIAHPGHINTFNYFIGPELARRGFRVMMVNYYGPEQVFEEFLQPLADAVRYLRKVPGLRYVVLAGHSPGGPELTYYQDVAENGPSACQGLERVYPCSGGDLKNLPAADGIMLLDSNGGAIERLMPLDPSVVDDRRPRFHQPDLNMYDPRNGFDPRTHGGRYSARFVLRYLKVQGERQTDLIARASKLLKKIDEGKSNYKDDAPFIIRGSSRHTFDGARLELADLRSLSSTRKPHLLIEPNGTTALQIIPSTRPPLAHPSRMDTRSASTQDITVRHFLSFLAIRTTANYGLTADGITGVDWRSFANSVPGNVQGIRVPSLFISGTCAPHLVLTEIAYDLSAAKDKEFVGVAGANHFFRPCERQYGDTEKHAFDFVENWLLKPGRFHSRR